jgi:hypothetical protein
MLKRKQPTLLLVLVLATITFLGYAKLWSGECDNLTPGLTTSIVEESIKYVTNCKAKLVSVYFWEDGCTPTATDDCWRKALPQRGVICRCFGDDCDDDFLNNVDNPNFTCNEIKQIGVGQQPCIVLSNPDYVSGGDAYNNTSVFSSRYTR